MGVQLTVFSFSLKYTFSISSVCNLSRKDGTDYVLGKFKELYVARGIEHRLIVSTDAC